MGPFSVAEELVEAIAEAGGGIREAPAAKKRLFEAAAEEESDRGGDEGGEMTDVKTLEDLAKRAGNGSSPSGSGHGGTNGKPPLGAGSSGAGGPAGGANGATVYAQQNGFSFRSPSPGPHEASPYYGHSQSHKKEGSRLLKHQLRVVRSKSGSPTIEAIKDELSFDKGFFLFVRALQMLVKKKEDNGPIIVGLAGPSGAGKTVFSSKVQSLIPGCAVLSMDMYNDASRLVDGNFDDPRLTDTDLLLKNIEGLRNGETVQAPIYDFKTSTRTGYRTVQAPKSRIVIVEGIYALTKNLRDRMDLRVSITGGVHFDLVKRVLRDISRSGQEPAEIIQQISETVYPMYKAFIEPDLKTAHLRIYNEFNPFSGFQNPVYTLKSSKPITEEKIREVCPELCVNREESEFHDIYLLPPTEDPETCNSWLRMRNKNGKYKLMFEEWVKEGDFIISPGISFEVSVRILGGLLALGYSIYLIMQRRTVKMGNEFFQIKLDDVEGFGHTNFVQIQGSGRLEVLDLAKKLDLDSYIPYPYIEQVQLENMTQQMRDKTEDMLPSLNLPGFGELFDSTQASPRKSQDWSGAYESGQPSWDELPEEDMSLADMRDLSRHDSYQNLSEMQRQDSQKVSRQLSNGYSALKSRLQKVEDELQGCREDIRKMKEMQSVDAMLKSQQQTINNLSQMCAVGGLGLVGALILLKISKHM